MGKKKDDKKNQKGGLGRTLMLFGVLVVGGIGTAWFLAPDFVQSQLDTLRGLIGS